MVYEGLILQHQLALGDEKSQGTKLGVESRMAAAPQESTQSSLHIQFPLPSLWGRREDKVPRGRTVTGFSWTEHGMESPKEQNKFQLVKGSFFTCCKLQLARVYE